jgi:hypothetical protein
MLEGKPDYKSYVLRLWTVRENDRWVYRASLQPIPDPDGWRRGFVDLGALFTFLEQQARPPDKPESPAPPDSEL